jgi:hypothetical protein
MKLGSLLATNEMFTATPNRDELRQGDILQGLHYPLMKCEQLRLIGEPADPAASVGGIFSLSAVTERESGVHWFTAQVQVSRGYYIVLSQCCDLERCNGKLEAPAFVVASLVDIPYPIRTDPEKLRNLQQNRLQDFVNLFYIPQYSPLPQAHMVDFSMPVSVPRSEFDFALSGKVLQMTDEARVCFKVKLISHFGRLTSEEQEIYANLYPGS